MIAIEDVDQALLRATADKFFRLVADSGLFRIKQLCEYVSLQLRVQLSDWHRSVLTDYVDEKGGKRDKLIPDLVQLPTKRKRGLPNRRHDKQTIDMFDEQKEATRGRRKSAR